MSLAPLIGLVVYSFISLDDRVCRCFDRPMLMEGRRTKPGEIEADKFAELATLFPREYLAEQIADIPNELDQWSGDIVVVDGDLHIDGNLHLFDENIHLLIVKGDLTIDGFFEDCDHPQTMTLVLGSMRVKNLITAGWLDVVGDLEVTGSCIGDYNDCSVRIGGDLQCHFFYPENHHFQVVGTARFGGFYGSSLRLNAGDVQGVHMELNDQRVLDFLDRPLVKIHAKPVETVEDIADFGDFKAHVRENKPLKGH